METDLRIVFPVILLLLFSAPVKAAKPIIVGGSGADLETFTILSESFYDHYSTGRIRVLPSIGSGGAIRGVLSGRVDIGLVARPLNDKERQHGLTLIHYADTALIYVVASGNHMTNLDIATLKAIYRGEDKGEKFTPILRPKADSDTLLIKNKLPELIPALTACYKRKGISVGMTDQSSIEMLIKAENAITTSTLSLVVSEQRPVQVLSLNGVTPSLENLAEGIYPLRKELYMVHDGQITEMESRFIEFVLSEEGREILARTGHVPVLLQQ